MKETLSIEKLDSFTAVCVANFLPSYQHFPAMGSDPIAGVPWRVRSDTSLRMCAIMW